MAAVYKSICNEADSLFLQCVKLMEDHIEVKLEIEKLMNEGFVDIAKARYIMGSTCVTKMQLPTENSNAINPVATVSRTGKDDDLIFNIERKDVPLKTDLNDKNDDSRDLEGNIENEIVDSSEAFVKVLKNYPHVLKKSKQAYLVTDKLYKQYNDELLDELSSDSDESLVTTTDPIRLFGILVPAALKQAQVTFKKVLYTIGKSATIQSELRGTLHKYIHMLKVKDLIEMAAKDIKMDLVKPKVYWTPSERSSVSCISYHSTSKDEEEGEDDEVSPSGGISVKKSIRSVFYTEPQENEMSIWSQDQLQSGSDD